ncbi:hypothetical protein ADIS_3472 [Lunatimonas lonarensis]|uniref:Uncharacterized protein n=1 Tax=Lunatimonas lonarensis TaxID=1232681 RepID=R7ZQQ7_9BACT|nr:hypothetical protein ADIS_3472 [Lunatimonas lonarensis]
MGVILTGSFSPIRYIRKRKKNSLTDTPINKPSINQKIPSYEPFH